MEVKLKASGVFDTISCARARTRTLTTYLVPRAVSSISCSALSATDAVRLGLTMACPCTICAAHKAIQNNPHVRMPPCILDLLSAKFALMMPASRLTVSLSVSILELSFFTTLQRGLG